MCSKTGDITFLLNIVVIKCRPLGTVGLFKIAPCIPHRINKVTHNVKCD